MATIHLIVEHIINHTEDTKQFVFKPVKDEGISYLPGQFITLIFQTANGEVRRAYSICSSPYTNEPISIVVKRIDNGFVSRKLHDAIKVGDIIEANMPTGLFRYTPTPTITRDIILIGAGSGITPLFSILKSALLKEPQSKITLIYSNHSVESTLFYDELKTLEQQYPTQFTCVFLFSNNKNLSFARLNRELLEKLITQYLQYTKEQALIYTCGPADYMLMCRIVLLGFGFEAEQLKKETFVLPEEEADEDNTTADEIDTNTYSVAIHFEGNTHTLAVTYPKTILDSALEQNLNLPYSCKSGVCGTCAATCTSGNVSMRYNEVLTDKDIKKGRVLLCTAHPLSENIKIEV